LNKVQQLLTVKAFGELLAAVDDLTLLADQFRSFTQPSPEESADWATLPQLPKRKYDDLFCEINNSLHKRRDSCVGRREDSADPLGEEGLFVGLRDDTPDDDG
jgi:hypothetical protein